MGKTNDWHWYTNILHVSELQVDNYIKNNHKCTGTAENT